MRKWKEMLDLGDEKRAEIFKKVQFKTKKHIPKCFSKCTPMNFLLQDKLKELTSKTNKEEIVRSISKDGWIFISSSDFSENNLSVPKIVTQGETWKYIQN